MIEEEERQQYALYSDPQMCLAGVEGSPAVCGWSIPSEAAKHIFVVETPDMKAAHEMAVCVGEFSDATNQIARFKCGHSEIPKLIGMERVTLDMKLCTREDEIPVRGADDIVRCTPLEKLSTELLPPIPNCLIYNDNARNKCAFLMEPNEERIEQGIEDLWVSKSSLATCSVDRHSGVATCSANFMDGKLGGVSVFRAENSQDLCPDPTTQRPVVEFSSTTPSLANVKLIKCVKSI